MINKEQEKFLREAQEIREGEIARDAAGDEQPAGWPGDGSGTDDFADYNANEADDYRGEGDETTVFPEMV